MPNSIVIAVAADSAHNTFKLDDNIQLITPDMPHSRLEPV